MGFENRMQLGQMNQWVEIIVISEHLFYELESICVWHIYLQNCKVYLMGFSWSV